MKKKLHFTKIYNDAIIVVVQDQIFDHYFENDRITRHITECVFVVKTVIPGINERAYPRTNGRHFFSSSFYT